jgi:hypothetical protein
MKKCHLSSLMLAFAVTWTTNALAVSSSKSSVGGVTAGASHSSSAPTHSKGLITSGKLRSFTTPAELKANKTIPPTNGGGATTGNAGSASRGSNVSGPSGTNFGFGRPLKKPVIAKTTPKAQP